MILTKEDAVYAAGVFADYFENFGRIDEYLREVKLERMNNRSGATTLGIGGPEDEMFSDFSMHPNDMNFYIEDKCSYFDDYIEIVSSHALQSSVPGKTIKWIVREKSEGKIVGFIRFGSPLLNSKPRNQYLGQTPELKVFNKHVIMGFIIVPVQPFGYNYLGGKLLALMCCSHKAREMINEKYDTDICMFETTSLYGSSKSASQYDGLKPFLRYKGLTDSNFLPLINDKKFLDLKTWFEKRNNDVPLVKTDASSRKLKTQQKMISIIKVSLTQHKQKEELKRFNDTLKSALDLTEKKRFYISDYGFSNTIDVVNGKTENLIQNPQNYEKFEFDNIVNWWKRKSSKRYEQLIATGNLRTEMELWSKNPDDIDIIR